jgi:hypothetical protein
MASDLNDSAKSSSGGGLAVKWRVLISVAVVLHLVAVIAAPLSVPPCSELERQLDVALDPYISAAYLNHGYRFFAPDPPTASYIVRYKLEFADGSTAAGRFPDLKTEWPRQFYHRHFMLTSKLTQYFRPPELPKDAPPEAREDWNIARRTFDGIAQSYAMHLLDSSGAKRVTLELVSHQLPSFQDLERGRPLSDPDLYKTEWSKSYEMDKS